MDDNAGFYSLAEADLVSEEVALATIQEDSASNVSLMGTKIDTAGEERVDAEPESDQVPPLIGEGLPLLEGAVAFHLQARESIQDGGGTWRLGRLQLGFRDSAGKSVLEFDEVYVRVKPGAGRLLQDHARTFSCFALCLQGKERSPEDLDAINDGYQCEPLCRKEEIDADVAVVDGGDLPEAIPGMLDYQANHNTWAQMQLGCSCMSAPATLLNSGLKRASATACRVQRQDFTLSVQISATHLVKYGALSFAVWTRN